MIVLGGVLPAPPQRFESAMSEAQLETEVKLMVPPGADAAGVPAALSAAGYVVAPLSDREIHDVYLDAADGVLFRAGLAVRLRREGDRVLLTAKALRPPEQGIARRYELEQVLGAPPPDTRRLPKGPVLDLALPAIGSRPLLELFHLRMHRRAWEVLKDGATVGELALDAGRFERRGRRGGDFVEVEVEASPGAGEALFAIGAFLTERLGLTPSERSKYERGLAWADLQPAGAGPALDLVVRPEDRFVDVAFRVFRKQHRAMVANEPGARVGLDPEYVHDMRVATRRLRAAFRVFGGAFTGGRLKGFEREYGWLGKRLGEVRDLDVQLGNLPAYRALLGEKDRPLLEPLQRHLQRGRERARRRMLKALDSKRYAGLIERFAAFLERGPARRLCPTARQPMAGPARELIDKALRKLHQRARAVATKPSTEQLHAVRLAAKRLRYVCEFFADLSGKRMAKFIKRLVRLQDVLGAHQDALVAAVTLLEYMEGARPRPMAREAFVLGRLIGLMDQRAVRLRGRFWKEWNRFGEKAKRKKVSRLLPEAGETSGARHAEG